MANATDAMPPHSQPDRAVRHFNQIDLSRRWKLSPRTLERWRWQRIGPPFLKIGGRVIYRLEDVEAFEANQIRQPASVINSRTK